MNDPKEQKQAPIDVRQAGRLGGITTATKYGREYYREIGKKGGHTTATQYKEMLSQFGKLGGRPRRP